MCEQPCIAITDGLRRLLAEALDLDLPWDERRSNAMQLVGWIDSAVQRADEAAS
jgi:hypothetical protein